MILYYQLLPLDTIDDPKRYQTKTCTIPCSVFLGFLENRKGEQGRMRRLCKIFLNQVDAAMTPLPQFLKNQNHPPKQPTHPTRSAAPPLRPPTPAGFAQNARRAPSTAELRQGSTCTVFRISAWSALWKAAASQDCGRIRVDAPRVDDRGRSCQTMPKIKKN